LARRSGRGALSHLFRLEKIQFAGRSEKCVFNALFRHYQLAGQICMFWYDGCTVASHPVVDWTEDECSWFVLVGRIAEGNQHALTEFYDVTNRSLRASTAHPRRLVFRSGRNA